MALRAMSKERDERHMIDRNKLIEWIDDRMELHRKSIESYKEKHPEDSKNHSSRLEELDHLMFMIKNGFFDDRSYKEVSNVSKQMEIDVLKKQMDDALDKRDFDEARRIYERMRSLGEKKE